MNSKKNEATRAAEIFARFITGLESGKEADPGRLYKSHPDLANELKKRFEAYNRLKDIMGGPVMPQPGKGRRLGEFRLLRKISRGGMGIVYEAVQLPLNRRVAVKVLSPSFMANRRAVSRFRREVSAIAKLKHPNIVTVHGVGQEDDVLFFAMDYVHGATLEEILTALTRKPLSS